MMTFTEFITAKKLRNKKYVDLSTGADATKYYSDIQTAVADINAGEMTNGADIATGATCAVFVHGTVYVLRLLSDMTVDSEVSFNSKDVVIDFNGKTMTFATDGLAPTNCIFMSATDNGLCLYERCGGGITSAFRIFVRCQGRHLYVIGGTYSQSCDSTATAMPIRHYVEEGTAYGADTLLQDCTITPDFSSNADNSTVKRTCIYVEDKTKTGCLRMRNVTASASTAFGRTYGVYADGVKIRGVNSTITATSTAGSESDAAVTHGIYATSNCPNVVLHDCKVRQTTADGVWTGQGVSAACPLYLKNCDVYGMNYAIGFSNGNCHINGGYYHGPVHGGIYVAGVGESCYAKNARFAWTNDGGGSLSSTVAGSLFCSNTASLYAAGCTFDNFPSITNSWYPGGHAYFSRCLFGAPYHSETSTFHIRLDEQVGDGYAASTAVFGIGNKYTNSNGDVYTLDSSTDVVRSGAGLDAADATFKIGGHNGVVLITQHEYTITTDDYAETVSAIPAEFVEPIADYLDNLNTARDDLVAATADERCSVIETAADKLSKTKTEMDAALVADKTALVGKGIDVPEGADHSDIAGLIDTIQQGGTPLPALTSDGVSVTADGGTISAAVVGGKQTGDGVSKAVQAATLDGNLVAANIKKDVTIFDVVGTFEGSGGGGYTDITVSGFETGNAQTLLDWIEANLPALSDGEAQSAVVIGNENASAYACYGFVRSQIEYNAVTWQLVVNIAAGASGIKSTTANPSASPIRISDYATIRVYDKVVAV